MRVIRHLEDNVLVVEHAPFMQHVLEHRGADQAEIHLPVLRTPDIGPPFTEHERSLKRRYETGIGAGLGAGFVFQPALGIGVLVRQVVEPFSHPIHRGEQPPDARFIHAADIMAVA